MATRKKVLKVLIIIILAIFLLSTGLISVMYLGGNTTTGTGDISSGEAIPQTGANIQSVVLSGADQTGDIQTGAAQ